MARNDRNRLTTGQIQAWLLANGATEQRGFTQNEICDYFGLTQPTVSRILNDARLGFRRTRAENVYPKRWYFNAYLTEKEGSHRETTIEAIKAAGSLKAAKAAAGLTDKPEPSMTQPSTTEPSDGVVQDSPSTTQPSRPFSKRFNRPLEAEDLKVPGNGLVTYDELDREQKESLVTALRVTIQFIEWELSSEADPIRADPITSGADPTS